MVRRRFISRAVVGDTTTWEDWPLGVKDRSDFNLFADEQQTDWKSWRSGRLWTRISLSQQRS